MRIALDVMGGDYAPQSNIQGLKIALADFADVERFLLVGPEKTVREALEAERCDGWQERCDLVQASQVVAMGEPSATPLRAKKDSSIGVCADLLKAKRADAMVSAGHTGAAVAATVVKIRLLPGLERPGIATVFPTFNKPFVILDVGANVDCKPVHLAQYAILGEAYSQTVLGVARPRVGLLNVGAEDGKGTDLTRDAARILKQLPLDFIGNVEGHDFFHDRVDVVVCDGFVGNALLKTSEALAKAVAKSLQATLRKTPMRMAGAFLSKDAFRELREIWDHEEYGGAPLLGVNGVCIIAHGSSSPWAVRNAIRVAREMVRHRINERISGTLGKLNWQALAQPANG